MGQVSAEGTRTSPYRFYKRCHFRRSGLMGYPVKQYSRAGRISSSFEGRFIKSGPIRHFRTIAQRFETFSAIGSGLAVNLEVRPINYLLYLIRRYQLYGFARVAVTPKVVSLLHPGIVMGGGIAHAIERLGHLLQLGQKTGFGIFGHR